MQFLPGALYEHQFSDKCDLINFSKNYPLVDINSLPAQSPEVVCCIVSDINTKWKGFLLSRFAMELNVTVIVLRLFTKWDFLSRLCIPFKEEEDFI